MATRKKRKTAGTWEALVKRRAFRSEDAPQFVVDAIRNAKMDKRHNHLNKLLGPLTFAPMMTTGGRITIPVGIRRKLKLRTGSQVDFEFLSPGRLLMVMRKR
jgi:hypothetical protein